MIPIWFVAPIMALFVLGAFSFGVTMERGIFAMLPKPVKRLRYEVDVAKQRNATLTAQYNKEVAQNRHLEDQLHSKTLKLKTVNKELKNVKEVNARLLAAEDFVIQELPY